MRVKMQAGNTYPLMLVELGKIANITKFDDMLRLIPADAAVTVYDGGGFMVGIGLVVRQGGVFTAELVDKRGMKTIGVIKNDDGGICISISRIG